MGEAVRYYPFDNYRGTPPNQTITDRDFTGQPQNRAVGLLYYQARFYVPSIGRFASADTLVPDPANPQSWNRYSYVNNQPLVYNDPTGHWLESAWDALNVGMGIASFVDNVKQGNYGWAAVDALGVVVDTAALVAPIVPGGVSAIIKGTRVADTAVDAIQTVNQVSNAAQTANQAANVAQSAQAVAQHADEGIEGVAIVKAYGIPPGGQLPHFSVEVRHGSSIMETEQVIRSRDMSSTTINNVTFPRPPERTAIVPLSDASAAQSFQLTSIGSELGPYGLSNNCVTHVCDVLRVGGAVGVPPSGSGLRDTKYIRTNLEMDEVFRRR